jgi:hypothetical protein
MEAGGRGEGRGEGSFLLPLVPGLVPGSTTNTTDERRAPVFEFQIDVIAAHSVRRLDR